MEQYQTEKEKADGAKAKVFKIGRELAVAVKEGGSGSRSKFPPARLHRQGKAANVPNDNIERIIKKAAGEGNANSFE